MEETNQERFEREQRLWLADQFDQLTVELDMIVPSKWAETRRYLPPSVTPMPGFYSFEVTPYLREILDCFATDSPVREVALMKGAQVGANSGVHENVLGFAIDHVKTAPVMFVTADADLAQLRLESYIVPMLQHSGLEHLIQSNDEKNPRKTGRTLKKIEWQGGGFLIPFGAQNANKLRSFSIQILLRDEIDGWPAVVGKDGDPIKLTDDRTAAYESSRKILDASTPLVKGTSKIEKRFERGDQRYYFVKCLRCEFPQILRWTHTNNETGEITGIRWEMKDGRLVPDSVRYHCQNCGHGHTEHDKTRLFAADNAEWRPTAEPVAPYVRSYHLSALYSPPGMQSWAECVQKWLEAWDVEKNRARDTGKLQVFYNNVLGVPFALLGESIRLGAVYAQRRAYASGRVPNKFATEFCGGPAVIVTSSVDVHSDCLKVASWGWCPWKRVLLVEYKTLPGDPSQLNDPGTWLALQELIERKKYEGDDGRKYGIAMTLIDSGYLTDQVYDFCALYGAGVFPVKGQSSTMRGARMNEFVPFNTKHGTQAFGINVDLYKDRWSAALKRDWDGVSQQPPGHFNAPIDATDDQLKELTAESKRPEFDKTTNQLIGYRWYRPSGAATELWDLLMYGTAALELIAWDFSQREELEFTDWQRFWDHCEHNRPHYSTT